MSCLSNEEPCLPIFVYGTLRPHQANYHYFKGYSISSEPAYLLGYQLLSLGRYPMAVQTIPDALPQQTQPYTSHYIYGDLIWPEQANYHRLLAELDVLEDYKPSDINNSMYWRVQQTVMLDGGRLVQAWFYQGNPGYLQAWHTLIHCGDWVAYQGQDVQAQHEREMDIAETLFMAMEF